MLQPYDVCCICMGVCLHRMAKSQLELDQIAHTEQLEASILQQKVGIDPTSVELHVCLGLDR